MTRDKTTKPAAAGATTGLHGIDQLGSKITHTNTLNATELQARWLTRLVAIDPLMAAALVPFIFGGARAQNSQ